MNRIYKYCPFCAKKLTKNINGYKACSCGFIDYQNARPTATALILNGKNELLLGKRSIEPFKDMWGVIGGFLNRNEDPISGAIREAKEETGLDIKIKDFICIITGQYQDPKLGFYYTFNVYYSAKVKGGKIKAADDVKEVKYFPINKLPKIAFINDQKAIKIFIKSLQK